MQFVRSGALQVIIVLLSVGPLLPFEGFTSILVFCGYDTGTSQGKTSGGAVILMPLDLHDSL